MNNSADRIAHRARPRLGAKGSDVVGIGVELPYFIRWELVGELGEMEGLRRPCVLCTLTFVQVLVPVAKRQGHYSRYFCIKHDAAASCEMCRVWSAVVATV